MTLQGFFMIIDAGMSQILPAKISLADTLNNQKIIYLGSLKVYLLIAFIFLGFGQVFCEEIVRTLLSTEGADFEIATVIFRLALLQFFFQLPNNSAIAFWIGRQEQHYSNVRQLKFAIFKHTSAAGLIFYNPSSVLYIAPFVFFCFFETVLNFLKITNGDKKVFTTLIKIKKFDFLNGIHWISAASILGMIGSQIDRLYLVRHLPLESYGKYIAISTLAMMFMNLNGPIYKALLPNFSVTKITKAKIKKAFFLVLLFAFMPCVLLAVFSNFLIMYWLREASTSLYIPLTFTFFILGVGLNGLNGIAFIIYIRDGLYKNLFYLNLIIVCIELLLLKIFYSDLSFFSGALAFFVGMFIQFIYGLFFLRNYLKNST
jgi:O-antigen/teichoic acid export membrane protein